MLLDTHIALWFLENNPKLAAPILSQIRRADHVYLSIVSLWEIAIKLQIGKLQLQCEFAELFDFLDAASITILNLEQRDIKQYLVLPLHHRDPFDHMIIAQAVAHSLPLISADAIFDRYPIDRIW